MRSIIKIVLLVIVGCNLLHAQHNGAGTGSIQVEITGIKNRTGQLGINLFITKEGFPADWQKAYKNVLIPIEGQKVSYTFTGIPYGKYAVSVMHDENKNKKLDTNFMGIPKEGVGVSNNKISSFGPPKFEDALFILDKSSYTITLNVNY
jgi:uncharacterized protein (DUF2141 family)